ncbi:MAG: hypothetical protein AAF918_12835 [Pseudomonadota bacterium]
MSSAQWMREITNKVLSALFVVVVLSPIAVALWPYDPDLSLDKKLQSVLNDYYRDRVGLADPFFLNLTELTDFEWDTVHVLGPYTSCAAVIRAVGFWFHSCHMSFHDHYSVLVFELEGSVVEYSNVLYLNAPGGVTTLAASEAKLEAVQSLGLEGPNWPKIREGIYVNWLVPAGRKVIFCTSCVALDRRPESCVDDSTGRETGRVCDLSKSYNLPIITPERGLELSKLYASTKEPSNRPTHINN